MSVQNLFALNKRKPDVAAGATEEVTVPAIPKQTSPVGMPSQTMVQQQQRQTVPAYSGGNNNAQAALDYLASAYTTPQREDEIRKASVMNQRIAAVADALRHIGNIYNTTQYAPSQQFNNPVQEEYARYLQGKSIRDAANQRYLTYMQQKAAQDAQMDRFEKEQEYKNNLLQHYKEQEERLREKDAATRENQEAKRDLDREKFEADKAFKDGKLSVAQYNAQTSRIRAVKSGRAGGGGGKYWAYDNDGNIHYFPNRTMWEQGIAEYSEGMDQRETFTNKNASGDTTTREARVKSTTLGGRLANNAKNRTSASTPSTGRGGIGRTMQAARDKMEQVRKAAKKKDPFGDNSKKENKKTNPRKNPFE